MKVIVEDRLEYYRNHGGFWNQARDNAFMFMPDELDIIEDNLTELYPDGIEDGVLNDIFWFEMEWLVELLGLSKQEVIDRFGDYFN